MFEVIICRVKTGRIQRKLFETREEAEQHIRATEDKLVNRMRNGVPAPVSLRDYRMEIHPREFPEVHPVPARRRKLRAA
jgi:hypothetical protein